VVHVVESRNSGRRVLIREAAKLLITDKRGKKLGAGWSKDATLKRDLAAHLSLLIPKLRLEGYRDEVQMHWVTRNRYVIETERAKRE
jgi:hypothetical protein